jgi:hypothetical protein
MRFFARVVPVVGLVALGASPLTGFWEPAVAAPAGGECSLTGSAGFDGAGLSATGGNFTYNFSGTLSSCQSNVSTAPTSGQVAAGRAYTVTQSGTDTTGPWSVTYGLPEATGSGGCAESQTQGTAVATWLGGTTTVISYTTTGAGVAVEFQGTVSSSATLNELSSTGTPPAGTPTTDTVSTTSSAFPVGDNSVGQLVFSTTNPTGCQTGLPTASINGVVALGSAS